MKKTEKKLSRYWDEIVSGSLPSYQDFKKMKDEIGEHFGFIGWAFKRIIVPLMVFYLAAGLLLGINTFGSLFVSLLVFLYSNFLPDTDFLIRKSENNESRWHERYSLLFFAPVFIYYVIAGRARPLYAKKVRCFHNPKAMFLYGGFLLIFGLLLWVDILKSSMLAVFGMLGFAFHLAVDHELKINKHAPTIPYANQRTPEEGR